MRVGKVGPLTSYLMFMDDLILFSETLLDQINMMVDCLNKFCLSLGQKVNYNKSLSFSHEMLRKRRGFR